MSNIIENTNEIRNAFKSSVVFSETHDIFGKIVGGVIFFIAILFFFWQSLSVYITKLSELYGYLVNNNSIIILFSLTLLTLLYIMGITGVLIFDACRWYILRVMSLLNKSSLKNNKLVKKVIYFTIVDALSIKNLLFDDDVFLSKAYQAEIKKIAPKYFGISMGYGDLLRLARLTLDKNENQLDKTYFYYSTLKNFSIGLLIVFLKMISERNIILSAFTLLFLIYVNSRVVAIQNIKDVENVDRLVLKIKTKK